MSNKIFTVMHEEYEPHPQISYILTSERGATLLKITQYVNAGDFHDYEKTAISIDWETAYIEYTEIGPRNGIKHNYVDLDYDSAVWLHCKLGKMLEAGASEGVDNE